jgi:cyclase
MEFTVGVTRSDDVRGALKFWVLDLAAGRTWSDAVSQKVSLRLKPALAGGTPFLLMGSVTRAIDVLENVVIPLGVTTTVPGHGPVFHDHGPVRVTLDYLRFVDALARRGLEAGVTPLQAAQDTDLGAFAGWPDAERIVGNLHRAYAELTGAQRGTPIDVMAALADMVTYNGGRPLTCLA